jgi:hypothetical protein
MYPFTFVCIHPHNFLYIHISVSQCILWSIVYPFQQLCLHDYNPVSNDINWVPTADLRIFCLRPLPIFNNLPAIFKQSSLFPFNFFLSHRMANGYRTCCIHYCIHLLLCVSIRIISCIHLCNTIMYPTIKSVSITQRCIHCYKSVSTEVN